MTRDSYQVGPATRVVFRSIVYYIVLLGIAALLWPYLPHTGGVPTIAFDALIGAPGVTPRIAQPMLDEMALAAGVAIAMLASVLLALPVAWIYIATRAKRGYQQSVVQLLVILPAVVAGVVLLVKFSLALAFSLAGIVAAIRFRNTLDDSKDAVYVFLATAVGLSAAVNLPVAAVLSIGFNITVVVLWYSDFGSSPVELDGRIADRRLKRARELARTGTFVARIDDEVLSDMTRDQLEGVAERAWRRAHGGDDEDAVPMQHTRLRIHTRDVSSMRSAVEPRLQEHVKSWRPGSVTTNDGVEVVEYTVQLRKRSRPEDLVALVRAAGSAEVLDANMS